MQYRQRSDVQVGKRMEGASHENDERGEERDGLVPRFLSGTLILYVGVQDIQARNFVSGSQ